MSRPPPWLLPSAAALSVALLAALLGLNAVFLDERDDSLERIASEEAALLAFARGALSSRLAQRLEEARPRLRAALEDPLVDDRDLLLVVDGRPRLPRAAAARPGSSAPALARLAALSEPLSAPQADGGPYATRLRLLAGLRAALQVDDRERIEANVRGLLAERALHRLPPSEEVPWGLVLIESLLDHPDTSPALLAGLLRDGLGQAPSRVEGLQRLLLESRGAFTAPDFEGLAERVTRLSARAGVKADDFAARAGSPPPRAVEVPPALSRPSLLASGRIYAEPASGLVEGVAVDVSAELAAISRELVERGLLGEESSLSWTREDPREPLALDEVPLALASPALQAARGDAVTRYRLKAGLLLGTGGLAAIAVALSLALDRRRRRFYELKARFLAAVSHELRTPLASLQLLAETLERRVGHLAEARDYPRRMLKDLEGLSFLVENLLSLQRVEKGRLMPRAERVDLEEVVCALEDELARVTSTPVELRFEADDSACELQADPELLSLCLSNLLRNACLYNAREPVRVLVSARVDGERVVVRVADNGVGIPDDLRPRLFEDFARGQDASARNPRGSGIGLALCQAIARAHGGSLSLAESSAEGSAFELVLPRRPRERRR